MQLKTLAQLNQNSLAAIVMIESPYAGMREETLRAKPDELVMILDDSFQNMARYFRVTESMKHGGLERLHQNRPMH